MWRSKGGAIDNAFEVAIVRRRAGRPLGEEIAGELCVIIMHRQRIDVHTIERRAVLRETLLRRMNRDARN